MNNSNYNKNGDTRLFDNLAGMQHDNLAGYYLIHGESYEKIADRVIEVEGGIYVSAHR